MPSRIVRDLTVDQVRELCDIGLLVDVDTPNFVCFGGRRGMLYERLPDDRWKVLLLDRGGLYELETKDFYPVFEDSGQGEPSLDDLTPRE